MTVRGVLKITPTSIGSRRVFCLSMYLKEKNEPRVHTFCAVKGETYQSEVK